jgi:hypothetical protein
VKRLEYGRKQKNIEGDYWNYSRVRKGGYATMPAWVMRLGKISLPV